MCELGCGAPCDTISEQWERGPDRSWPYSRPVCFDLRTKNEWDGRDVLSIAKIADKKLQNTIYEAFEQRWSWINGKFRRFSLLVAPCDDFTEYLPTVNILLPGNDPKLWNQSHHCALCCAVHGHKLWRVLFRLKTKRELIQKCVTAAVRRLSRSFIATEPGAADFISGIVQIIYLLQWPFSKARKIEKLNKNFNIKYYRQFFYDARMRVCPLGYWKYKLLGIHHLRCRYNSFYREILIMGKSNSHQARIRTGCGGLLFYLVWDLAVWCFSNTMAG